MSFLEIIGGLGSGASVFGITLKDLISKFSNHDKKLIENYFVYLEGRRVLVAPFDAEITNAVIKSLEEIKTETDTLRLQLDSKFAQHIVLTLITALSGELMELYRHHNGQNSVLFYKTLQIIRTRYARALALLCNAYKIDISIKQTELAKMVLNHAYHPK